MTVFSLLSGTDLVKKKEKAETARSINWSTGSIPLMNPKQAVIVRIMKTTREAEDSMRFMCLL